MTEYAEEHLDRDALVQRAVTSSATVALRGVAIRSIGLATNLVLARLLAPSEFGVAALGFALVTCAQFLADGGLGAGLIRRAHAPSRLELQAILGFQLTLSVVTTAVALAVATAVGGNAWVVVIMVSSLCAVCFQAPGAILLERRLNYGKRVIVEIVEAVTYSGVAIVSVALGAGVWGLAVAVVIRGVVGAVAMNILTPFLVLRPRMNLRAIRDVLAFGIKFQGIAAVNLLRDQGLNLGLAAIGGVGALGLWALASRVLQIPLVLFESLWRVSFPAMSRLEASGNDASALLSRIIAVVSLLGGLVLAPLAATSPNLLGLVFGDVWQSASAALLPACLGLVVAGPLSVAAAGYLFARGQAASVFRAAVAHTIAWTGIGLGAFPWLGIVAIGLGALVGSCVEAYFLIRTLRRAAGINALPMMAIPSAVGIAAACAGAFVCTALPQGVLGLVAAALTAETLFLAGMLLQRDAYRGVVRVLHHLRHAA